MKALCLSTLLLFAGSALAEEVSPYVPTKDIQVPDDLEITLWAKSPLFQNPTNMDTDARGRIWVAEGVNYRRAVHRSEGDRIVVIEDTVGDGRTIW